MQLFVDRAQAVRPDFQVTPGNAAAVGALCARLEGIPLAIELMAARSKVPSPAQMLAQLSQRLNVPPSRQRAAPARHRTLRAALDWSYQLLPRGLQPLFTSLSVFRGGWTADAAAAICASGPEAPMTDRPPDPPPAAWARVAGKTGDSPSPSAAIHPEVDVAWYAEILDDLAQLRSYSLVLAEDVDGEMRFRMLETVREYAAEQLSADGQTDLAQRHLTYYGVLAEIAEPQLVGTDQAAWLERLDREHDNLRAALTRSVDTGSARRPLEEWLPGLRSASAFAASGCSMDTWTCVAERQSDYGAARAFLEESLAIRREIGDRAGIAYCLDGLAGVAFDRNQLARAARLFAAAAALRDALGVPPPDATPDGNHLLATLHARLGDEPFAAAWAEGQAISLDEAIAATLDTPRGG